MKQNIKHKFTAALFLVFYLVVLGGGVFLDDVMAADSCRSGYSPFTKSVNGQEQNWCYNSDPNIPSYCLSNCSPETTIPSVPCTGNHTNPDGTITDTPEGCVRGSVKMDPPVASSKPYEPKYLPTSGNFDFTHDMEGNAVTGIAGFVKVIYQRALIIVGAIAFGVVIYGAVLWVISGASPSKLGEAKSWIIGAILGTILLFGAVLILNEINPNITQNMSDPLDAIPETQIVAPPPPSTGVLVGGTWPPESMSGSDASVRNNLANNGAYPISVNKSNCTSVGQTGCTSLDGLPSSTVDDLKSLANSAKEPLTVTGGTEYWLHSTHGPGKPVVDIAYDPKAWTAVQKSSDIAFYQCERNGVKVDPALVTPDHIHIKFK